MFAAVTQDHLFWVTSRAAGTAALLFSSVAVGLGLAMALKLVKGRGGELRVTHEALSLATLAALGVHVVSLLGDSYLKPSLADITIPFVSGYKEPWMSIGIVAGWALVLLAVSFYFRRQIGAKRWRTMHRFTSVAWLAAVAHSLGEGTDAGMTWFTVALGVVALPALVLLMVRWLGAPARPTTA
jgi:methionine sulfoxide reductase heme-binding subunit